MVTEGRINASIIRTVFEMKAFKEALFPEKWVQQTSLTKSAANQTALAIIRVGGRLSLVMCILD